MLCILSDSQKESPPPPPPSKTTLFETSAFLGTWLSALVVLLYLTTLSSLHFDHALNTKK